MRDKECVSSIIRAGRQEPITNSKIKLIKISF